MRRLVERLFGRCRPARHRRADGASYRSRFCVPLDPGDVRSRRFRRARLGRRGVDPDEVRAFLDRVALELAYAQESAQQARRDSQRIKDALRCWQSAQADSVPGPALLPYR
ncbi:DivIVA domain-containing protein [Micromonospora sp. NPDC003197]